MMYRSTFEDFLTHREQICVLGLGYVGLPLAVCLARKFKVVGYDINQKRIEELRNGQDKTREITAEQLKASSLSFSTDSKVLKASRLIIVTVPTPIDLHKNPDLTPLIRSSTEIGKQIVSGTTIVFESTVYPGCTEDDCIPIIEMESGLTWKTEFFCGYSPERINPGDKEHTVDKVKKIVSGDTPETANFLNEIYAAVITAGTHLAPNIKTAEAAKVIENTQRDLNIALMNEIAMICEKLNVQTLDVLEAAGTKWNFLHFRPGLVGGHCIGVDPYYLTFKAESMGYHSQVILAGRQINDGMGKFIAEKTIKLLIAADRNVKLAKVLILGWTFKENVGDIRNTKVVEIYRELLGYGINPICCDPEANKSDVLSEYGVALVDGNELKPEYDAIILAVNHEKLRDVYNIKKLIALGGERSPILVDVKGIFKPSDIERENLIHWQL